MKATPSNPSDEANLRSQAEARLKEKQEFQPLEAAALGTTHDTQRLVQELQIHQIELEMQNEQLEKARAETQGALERYTDLYDFAPAGYFTLDRDGTIRQVNLTGSELLGVERSGLVNRRLGLFVVENSRPVFNAFVEKVFASQSRQTCEAMLLRKGKIPFHARIEGMSDGRECRAVVVDTTERRRMEERLRESEKMLQLVLDTIPQGIFWKNRELIYLGGNRRFVQDCGCSDLSQIVGKTDLDVPWKAVAELYRADDQQVMESGRPKLGYEESLPRLDGTQLCVLTSKVPLLDTEGHVTGVLDTYEDITEQKLKQQERQRVGEALRQSETELKEAQRVAHVGNWRLDLATNQVVWSEEIYRLLGLNPNLPPPPYPEQNRLFTSESWQRLSTTVNRTLETGMPYELELEMIRSDGSKGWMLARGESLRDEHGAIVALRGTAQDITDRKGAEEDLKLLNETLEQRVRERTAQAEGANCMKSEFLANMSHELRTPLNGIIGFAEFLVDGKPGTLNPKQTEYLEDILNCGRHLLQLINDVLDLAKVEAGKMKFKAERFALCNAIGEVCSALRPMKNKTLTIDTEVDPVLDEVTLDKQKFKQILFNLLSNAVKFTDSGGSVIVIAQRQDRTRLRLRVRDNGIGIKTEDLNKLFNQFEQLDSGLARRHQGTGLGLALTKKIVELQGGTIEVESEVGKGSTFTVVLPDLSETKVA
jgi:PAS domain S-box-containing protein